MEKLTKIVNSGSYDASFPYLDITYLLNRAEEKSSVMKCFCVNLKHKVICF